MTRIPVFFLEDTDRVRRRLRRYVGCWEGGDCTVHPYGYHNAEAPIEEGPAILERREGRFSHVLTTDPLTLPHEDLRWPQVCVCGYVFQERETQQLCYDMILRRVDTGEEMTWREAPVGAMEWADWNLPHYAGPDGHSLHVKTPGGDWLVDSRANNCTLPEDTVHRCWVRHGDPRDPQGLRSGQPLHVDKNGVTCQAGAGSILAGSFHGFLHHGYLEGC